MLARAQKLRTALSLEWRENPKGALDRRLKVCAKDNLCTTKCLRMYDVLYVRVYVLYLSIYCIYE